MIEENDIIGDNESDKSAKFRGSLDAFPEYPSLEGVQTREYQLRGVRKTVNDMLGGHRCGQFILGTGGGKTVISKLLIAHTSGKTLYVGPSRASVERGEEELKIRKINKTSQRLEGGRFDPTIDVTYATWQAMVANDYRRIPRDHFDLIIFDEAHHFMGEEVSQIEEHFSGHQVHMTATPGNLRRSLAAKVPHKYFEYTSEDLIRNDGYPAWKVYRHEVSDEHLENAKVVGDEYKIEGEETKILNMPHRFAIAYKLFKESVAKGERRLAFMPSVPSSKEFIDKVINKDPELAGKVMHVDGTSKNIDEIISRFKKGDILGVCCKSLWDESLDIPEIAAITLADPCRSARVLLQRIGRGARPANGKEFLRIDDVVSTIPNMRYGSAMQSKRPLSVHGLLGRKQYIEGAVVNGPEADVLYRDATNSTAIEIPVHERIFTLDISFIANAELGAKLFKEFGKVFGSSPINLIIQPEKFFDRKEKVLVESNKGESFEIDFKDAYDAAITFRSLEKIRAELFQSVEVISKQVKQKIREAVEGKPLRTELNFDELRVRLSHFEKQIMTIFWGQVLRKRKTEGPRVSFRIKDLQDIINTARAKVGEKPVTDGSITTENLLMFNFADVAAANGIAFRTSFFDNEKRVVYIFDDCEKADFPPESRDARIRRRRLEAVNWRSAEKIAGNDVRALDIFAERIVKEIIWTISNEPEQVKVNKLEANINLTALRDEVGVTEFVDYRKVMEEVVREALVIAEIKIAYELKEEANGDSKSTHASVKVEFPPEEDLLKNEEKYQKTKAILSLKFDDPDVNTLWNLVLKESHFERSTYTGIYETKEPLSCFFGCEWEDGPWIPLGDYLPKDPALLKAAVSKFELATRKLKAGLAAVGIDFDSDIKLDEKGYNLRLTKFDCDKMPGVTVDGYSPPKGVKLEKTEAGKKVIVQSTLINKSEDSLIAYLGRVDVKKFHTRDSKYLDGFKKLWTRLFYALREHEVITIPWNVLESDFACLNREKHREEIEEALKVFARELSNEYMIDDIFRENLRPELSDKGVTFHRPSKEYVGEWEDGFKKWEVISKIKFGDPIKQMLWKAVLKGWSFEKCEESGLYQFVNDYDVQNIYVLDVKVEPLYTKKLEEMSRTLSKYGIEMEILKLNPPSSNYEISINFSKTKVDA